MKRTPTKTVLLHATLIIAVIIICLPVILAFIISSQSETEVFSSPPKLTFSNNWVYNYQTAWKRVNLGRMMFNSALIASLVTFGKIVMSLLAAFAFSHFEFKGKQILFFLVIITLLLPVPVRIVALFDVVSALGWINTYAGLVAPFLASATGTFLFIQRFKTIPIELIDASKMDGCRPMQYFFQSVTPSYQKYYWSSYRH